MDNQAIKEITITLTKNPQSVYSYAHMPNLSCFLFFITHKQARHYKHNQPIGPSRVYDCRFPGRHRKINDIL